MSKSKQEMRKGVHLYEPKIRPEKPKPPNAKN
jgi:hypothetical protein